MADYDIYFYCDDCKDTHPAGIKIPIKGGPPIRTSIGAFYATNRPPAKITNLIDSRVLCPKAGKLFTQKDMHQIFLVPIA